MNDAIITLAWPDQVIPAEGKWYDLPMRAIGVLTPTGYHVGHCAMLLRQNGSYQFFDFGRYHTKARHGKIRSGATDQSVKQLNEQLRGRSLEEVLLILLASRETMGNGRMVVSVCEVDNLDLAMSFIKETEKRGEMLYGPLYSSGLNCSRFVSQAIRRNVPGLWRKTMLYLPYTVSVTPWLLYRVVSTGERYEVTSLGIKESGVFLR